MEQPEKPAPTTEKEEGKKSTSENKGAKENKNKPFFFTVNMANILDSRLNDRMKKINTFLMNKRNRLVEDAKKVMEMKVKRLQEDLDVAKKIMEMKVKRLQEDMDVEIKRIDEDIQREGEIEFFIIKDEMEKERLRKEKEPEKKENKDDGKDQ